MSGLLFPVASDLGADGYDLSGLQQQINDLRAAVQALSGNDLGYPNYGARKNQTSYSSDADAAYTLQNQGAGGHLEIPDELLVKSDGTGTDIRALASDTATIATASVAALAATNLTVSQNSTLGDNAGVDVVTLNAQLIAQGVASFNAATTHKANVVVQNAAGSLYTAMFDQVNGRTIIGNTLTALSGATADVLNVVGRSYFAPASAGNIALSLRRSTASGNDWGLGVLSSGDLAVSDNSGAQVAQFGGSGGTLQFQVQGDAKVSDDMQIGARLVVGATSWSGSEALRIVGATRQEGNFTGISGTFDWQNSGNSRLKLDSVGLGAFGATPVGRQTVTGTRTGTLAELQTVIANLLSAFDGNHLGFITDLTS